MNEKKVEDKENPIEEIKNLIQKVTGINWVNAEKAAYHLYDYFKTGSLAAQQSGDEVDDATQFADWIIATGWGKSHFGWYDPNEKNPKYYSTNQLYKVFKSLPQPPSNPISNE